MTVIEEELFGPQEADRAFRVEQRGIDYVPDAERWARPHNLAGMWAGASFQIEYFIYGVILMAFFGLTFAQAVWVIIVGNLSFALLGIASLQGPESGTTTMATTRAAYGPNGSRLISGFNWITQVGFETEGLILIVYAAQVLDIKAGFDPGTPAKVVFILIGVAIQMMLPLFGHATIVKTLQVLAIPFLALFAILAALALPKAHLDAVTVGGNWEAIMVALAFTIALSGLGWTENGNDYSRYLPRSSSKSATVAWVFLGTAVPETLIMILGAAVGTYATAVATGPQPFAAFVAKPEVISTWFVVPFLVASLVQLFAINSLDLYSSGVTLQAMGAPVRRWQAVVIDTVIACGLTFYAVFSSSFHNLLSDFADVVICWIAPWFAIFIVDWILRRFRYVPAELQDTTRTSLYWGTNGISWPAIIAQMVGTVIAVLSVSQSGIPYYGVIARALGSKASGYPDFSIFFGIIAAGLVYFLLARRAVRRQADRQDALLAS